jgi:riboflavin biosynthesis pyrimidine reductase
VPQVDDGDTAPPRFTRLVPGPPAELSAAESLADWGPSGDGVALNMIASVDGRIAVDGRSRPLGGPADRALFHSLREHADAVMAGAGTIRAERYGPMIRDRSVRERRRANGLEPNPVAVIVSRSLEIDPTVPLLADPDSRVAVLTPSAGTLTGCAARIEYIRAAALRPALAELRERYGVRSILCEGGPRLNGSLAAESLVDEIFIALSPLLVGDVPGGRAVVLGNAPPSPRPLELRTLLTQDGTLFAHYVVS